MRRKITFAIIFIVFVFGSALNVSAYGENTGQNGHPVDYKAYYGDAYSVEGNKLILTPLPPKTQAMVDDLLANPSNYFAFINNGSKYPFKPSGFTDTVLFYPVSAVESVTGGALSGTLTVKSSHVFDYLQYNFGEVLIDGSIVGRFQLFHTISAVGANQLQVGSILSQYSTSAYKSSAGAYYIDNVTFDFIGVPPDADGGGDDGFLKGLLDGLLEILKKAFVPSEDFFQKFYKEISDAFNAKMGNIPEFFEALKKCFETFQSDTEGDFHLWFDVPNNQFFAGYAGIKVDLLAKAAPLFSWLKTIFTVTLIIFTIVICYRKLIDLFRD